MNCELSQVEHGKWWCPICDPDKRRLLPINARRNCGVRSSPSTPLEPRVKGPGDYLHVLILRKYGQKAIQGCGCNEWIAKMNRWDCDGCREHADEIAARLVEQAKKAGYKRASLPGAHTYCKHRLVLVAVGMAEEVQETKGR